MTRLNIERQTKLEPIRMKKAIEEIEKKGYEVHQVNKTQLVFIHKDDCIITYYPYSGWATGCTIRDGRGLNNLLKQI